MFRKNAILLGSMILVACLFAAPGSRAQTGNPHHDQVAALDEAGRRAALARLTAEAGAACPILVATYFAGLSQDRTAFWDSRCRDGAMYRLSLPAHRLARPSMQVCGASGGGIAAGPCFQPLGTAPAATPQTTGGTGTQLAATSAQPPPGSRFGAIYGTDVPLAAWGFGNGSADRLAVNTSAVRACQAMAGRVPCRFVDEIVNQCGALVQALNRHPRAVAMTSDLSTMVLVRNFPATAATQQAAEAAAMEQCQRIPGATCRLVASSC